MLSESLAQYTSLMVMKHEYGPEHMQRFLKCEMDRYLNGRSGERKKEFAAHAGGDPALHLPSPTRSRLTAAVGDAAAIRLRN